MSNEPLAQASATAATESQPVHEHTHRRSVSHGSAEHERAVAALQDGMDRLRRAEDTARQAGYTFRRALREVKECQETLAQANARLQRVPWPKLTLSPGSV